MIALKLRHHGLAAALVLGCALTVFAQAAAPDIVGTWKGTMETQIGTVENVITIESAAPLAGQVKVGDYDGKIEKGKVEGSTIHFEVSISHGVITYDGTIKGEEIAFTVTGTSGTKMALTAKRQK